MSDQKTLYLKFEILGQIHKNISNFNIDIYKLLFVGHELQVMFFEPPFRILD